VALVNDANREALRQAQFRTSPERCNGAATLSVERRGAIRLGRTSELFNMRRALGVMGYAPREQLFLVGGWRVAPRSVTPSVARWLKKGR
jgi:hypothetical protein